MVSIETLVWVVLFLLGCAAIVGLLYFLIHYVARRIGAESSIFVTAADIALVVLSVLILIGIILDLMGHPIVAWRR